SPWMGNHDAVNSPTIRTSAGVAAHAPAQYDILPGRGRWQGHRGGDEASGVPAPRLATRERIAKTGANRSSVAACNKAAACGNDIGKCASADTDLQHSTVKETWWAGLQIEVVAEGHLCSAACDGNAWRVEPLVADYRRIIHPRSIGQRIGRGCRQSGI